MANANYSVNLTRRLTRALATNSSSSSFPSKVPTITEPVNDGVINLRDGSGVESPQWMTVLPYGVSSNDDAFSVRVIGWRRVGGDPSSLLWVPTILCEMACTMGTSSGATGGYLDTTALFCDTITVVSEPTITADITRQGTVELFNPGNDLIGYFRVKLCGVEKVEFTFDQTTNSPTMNCLIANF